MTLYQKLNFLFSYKQKRELKVLAVLLLVGMVFEMAGLGVMVPALTLMLKSDIGTEYPALKPYLAELGDPSQAELVFWGLSFLVFVYVIKAVFMVYLSWRQNHFSSKLTAELASRLFLGYLKQPYSFHLQRNSAGLIQNIQHEVNVFNVITVSAIMITTELSMAISIAVMLIFIEPVGALTVTVFLGLFAYIFSKVTQRKLVSWGKLRQVHLVSISKHVLQGLSGVKDVKISGTENYFLKEFDQHNVAQSKINTKVHTLATAPRLYLEILAAIGLSALVSIMIYQAKPLHLLLPVLGVFGAAAFRLMPSVNRIMTSIQNVRYSQSVIDLLYNELHAIKKHEAMVISSEKIDFRHLISIDNLHFRYSGSSNEVLKNISLSIKKGESVGFIGSSGAGKSTLVDLILGLLQPSDGSIRVDSNEISNNIRAWQNQIGYVPQAIYLIDDTLRKNIAFGIEESDIDDDRVKSAVKAAQLESFVMTSERGIESEVGERGVRLSGGQRQRIGIARALYNNPEVLVFDEATSALDVDTERSVVETIMSLHGLKTIIVVAHRLSTVEHCDRLYRLEAGRISEVVKDEVFGRSL